MTGCDALHIPNFLHLLLASSIMGLLASNQLARRCSGGGVPNPLNEGTVGMSHYKSNLRDIEFNLFEVFGAGDWMSGSAPNNSFQRTAGCEFGRSNRSRPAAAEFRR